MTAANSGNGVCHTRDERATREKFDLIGKEIPDGQAWVAWCGKVIYHRFMFGDPGHALTHLRYSGSLQPCRSCLIAMRNVIAAELGSP